MIKKIFLLIILGGFFRLYQLGQIPNSYTPDEVAQGYTAYSFLHTGQDEWANKNIFSLRSFGDFKPPLQTILIIPSIKVFGLTPFAIRFPNALLSILLIPLAFILAQKLFQNQTISFISTLLVTFSPTLIPLSRLALEANLVILISLAAIIFYLYRHYYLSLFFFSLSLLTYHSAKIFFPLSLLILFLFFKSKKIYLFLAVLIFIFISYLTNSSRSNDIAIFNPTDSWSSVSQARYQVTLSGLPDTLSRIFNNKLTYTVNLFTKNYLSYLSPQFLATDGAAETTYGLIPGQGIIGLVGTLGLILSLLSYLKTKDKSLLLLILLILSAILPAALAKGNYAANRASLINPYIQILSAFGLYQLFSTKNKIIKYFLLLLFIFESSNFLVNYFFRANQILSNGLLYGHRQAIEYLSHFPDSTIIYSRRLSEPQAYVSFFGQINPVITQQASQDWLRYQQKNLKFLDQLGEYNLANYIFKEINFASDSQIPNSILVGRPEEFPGTTPDKIIYYPDYNHLLPAIFIYHSK